MTGDQFGLEQAKPHNHDCKTSAALSAALQTLEGTT